MPTPLRKHTYRADPWDWRRLASTAGMVVFFALVAAYWRFRDQAATTECLRLYASAHSARDSAGVDMVVVGSRSREPLECGTLLRAGALRPAARR